MYSKLRVAMWNSMYLEIDKLARINLIAGKNKVGKSALLDAIYESRKPAKQIAGCVLLSANAKMGRHEITERFSTLKHAGQVDLLIEAIRIVEPRVYKLSLLSGSIYADLDGIPHRVPLASMGEGITRLSSIILAISASKNGIALIDEIESSLHYSTYVEAWQMLALTTSLFNVQLFVTTHSLEMIRTAQQVFRHAASTFRYYRLDRNTQTGEIDVVIYSPQSLDAAIAANLEVR